jgi:replicative DNA helicase
VTVPQQNLESEAIVLGRALLEPGAKALEQVTAADFALPANAAVWTVLAELGPDASAPLARARLDEAGQDALDRAVQEASLVGTEPHVAEIRACALRRRQLAEISDLAEDVKAGRGTGRIARLEELEDPAQADERYTRAVAALYGEDEDLPAVWGEGPEVLWQAGEPLYIVGPTGTGKTTITQQLVAGRLGLRSQVLGMHVEMHESRVLYLACDRPRQATRAFRRLIPRDLAEDIDGELVMWKGPPPADFGVDPDALYAMCRHVGADTVIIDSVKDVVGNLADPNQGQQFNRAVQTCVTNGVEVLGLHHTRKRVPGTKVGIDDLFGGWIAAGAGSVIMLQGEPGDLIVDFLHLKQPAETVGPWKVEHDHRRGESKVTRTVTDLRMALANVPRGMTATELAAIDGEGKKPTTNEVARTARRAERLVEGGRLVRLEVDGQVRYAVAAP